MVPGVGTFGNCENGPPTSSFRHREGAWLRPDPGGERREKPVPAVLDRSPGYPPHFFRSPPAEPSIDDELSHKE